MRKMTIIVVLAAFGLAVQTASANLIVTAGNFGAGNTNVGFEADTTGPWTVWEPKDRIDVSADFSRLGGLKSLKIDSTGMALTDFQVSDYINITGGETYDASAWYYLPETLNNYEAVALRMIYFSWDDGGWTQVGTPSWAIAYGPEPGYETKAIVGEWTQLSLSVMAPLEAVMVDISLQARGAGSTFYFDDVSLIPEPGTAIMLVLGVGLLWFRRRFR